MASSFTRQYVQPGACLATIPGGSKLAVSCALEVNACPQSAGIAGAVSVDFVSSRQLKELGSDHPGFSCLDSDGNDPNHYVLLGRCVARDDAYVCTSAATNCKRPEVFEPQDEMCTLLADISPTRVDDRAMFASCRENGGGDFRRCFWTRDDCPEGHINYGANPYSNYLLCPCDDTETGACYDELTNDYACAVSSAGCDNSTVFLNVHQLQEQARIDCRLCRTPTKIPDKLPAESTSSGSATGNSQGVVSPNITGSTASSAPAPTEQNNSSSGLNKGGIIAIAVTGGVFLGLILTLIGLRIRRRRRNNTTKGGTAIVVETVDANRNDHESQQTEGDVRSLE